MHAQKSLDTIETEPSVISSATRVHCTWEVGDAAHQGDLIFVGIDRLPTSATPRQNRQLADGQTRGSRHVCERGDVYEADATEAVALIHEATGIKIA